MYLVEVVRLLGTAPDGALDEPFRSQCVEFAEQDTGDVVRFLRNLRDELVYTAGCSDRVIDVISTALEPWPESEEDCAKRRAELEAKRAKS